MQRHRELGRLRATGDDRGVRGDSVTSQLRAWAKHSPKKRPPPVLEPIDPAIRGIVDAAPTSPNNGESGPRVSVQKQIQGPVSLQWLVDDFVQAAGVGDVGKVDYYIRGGIPIDMKHSVLQYSALHASAALTNETITKHLVQAGADVDALTKDRDSTLHLAARYHSEAVAEEVLRNKAEMRLVNKSGQLAMDVASDVQDRKLAQLLEPPPRSPSNVHATSVSATSLSIAWTSHCADGSAYVFRVSWSLVGSTGDFSETCKSTTFRVSNLMPASRYRIRVEAGNHTVGWSTDAEVLEVVTDGDVPNAMAAPVITEVSESTITMRLRLPPCNGAEVERLSIQVQCTGSLAAVTTSSFRRLLRPAEADQRWEGVLCDVPSMSNCEDQRGEALPGYKAHKVRGLLPGHVYFFRVKASNRYGWSPDGEISDGICTNDMPKVVAREARAMTLVWTKPYSTERIDRYQVLARISYNTHWDVVATDIAAQHTRVTDLLPATAYCFRVVPHYALRGWEEPHKSTETALWSTEPTVPEPPVGARVVDRTASSVSLRWDVPRCNGYAVTSYQLDCRPADCAAIDSDGGDWWTVEEEIGIDFGLYVVERLRKGRAYEFRVRARNHLGDGLFAPTIGPVWTYPFVPPQAPTCLARSSFSLEITWEDGFEGPDADDPHEPLTLEYEVQMCHVDSSELRGADATTAAAEEAMALGPWVTVLEGHRSHVAQITNLTPLGCYRFRVRARAATSATPDHEVARGLAALTAGSSRAPETEGAKDANVFSPISAVFQTIRRM